MAKSYVKYGIEGKIKLTVNLEEIKWIGHLLREAKNILRMAFKWNP